MKWDSEADQHLLLAILSAHKVTVDYTRVAPFIGCTPRACEERIKKLRKQAKEGGYDFIHPASGSAFGGGGGGGGGPGKGRKKKGVGGTFSLGKKGGGKGSGKGKGKGGAEDGDDDEEEVEDRKVSVAELEAAIESGGAAGGEMKIKREPGYLSTPSFDEASSDQDDNNSGGEEEPKPAVKRRKTIAVGMFEGDSSNASFASTASGMRIPLGVPLEVATGPLNILGYSEGGFNRTPRLLRGIDGPRNTLSCPRSPSGSSAGGGLRRGFGIESAGFTVVGNGIESAGFTVVGNGIESAGSHAGFTVGIESAGSHAGFTVVGNGNKTEADS